MNFNDILSAIAMFLLFNILFTLIGLWIWICIIIPVFAAPVLSFMQMFIIMGFLRLLFPLKHS